MKRRASIKQLNLVGSIMSVSFLVVMSVLFVSTLVYGEDRLVVKDDVGQTKFLVTTDGKVGIGTATPTQALHVEGAPGGTALLFRAAPSSDAAIFIAVPDALTNTPNLTFMRAGVKKWFISDAPGDDSLRMSTTKNGTNLVINSGGDVGIGTVPPGGHKLYGFL